MTDLDAGILNKRITIQRLTMIDDGETGFDEEWLNVGTYWAEVKPLSAKQVFEYNSLNVEATHRIKIRGNIAVDETDRILFDSRIFEILTVEDENEDGVVSWITCKESRS